VFPSVLSALPAVISLVVVVVMVVVYVDAIINYGAEGEEKRNVLNDSSISGVEREM